MYISVELGKVSFFTNEITAPDQENNFNMCHEKTLCTCETTLNVKRDDGSTFSFCN